MNHTWKLSIMNPDGTWVDLGTIDVPSEMNPLQWIAENVSVEFIPTKSALAMNMHWVEGFGARPLDLPVPRVEGTWPTLTETSNPDYPDGMP